MRYKRAVEKLRVLAEACERVKMFWFDTEPFLKAVYAFGEVVDGADPLDAVQVAVAINLSPAEVPWESSPEGTDWLAEELRLSKGGFLYFWRSYLDPIWSHHIGVPVRIWSVDDGPDERALTALEGARLRVAEATDPGAGRWAATAPGRPGRGDGSSARGPRQALGSWLATRAPWLRPLPGERTIGCGRRLSRPA
jgi:hypothetical protein